MSVPALTDPQALTVARVQEWALEAAAAREYCRQQEDTAGADEIRRRIQAVYSYIADKKARSLMEAELRRTEVLVGVLLGEPRPGERTDITSSKLEEVELSNAEKNRFRELAANEEKVEELLEQGVTKRAQILKRIEEDERIEEARDREEEQSGAWPVNVLVIDPPWRYESRAKDPSHRARNPYEDMSVEEIKTLDVPDRITENAIVWLWTTNAFMRDAYEIAAAWDLQVRTILTWAKDRMGTGDWLRGQTEHCLLATRGKPVRNLTNETTLLHGPLREHSRKPDEFYELVDRLCPGTKGEMFARQTRPGWAAWGDEAGKFAA